MTHLTLIKTPSETDIAWAEHAERQRIASGYWNAFEARDFNTAWEFRQEAVAYDRLNPGSSSLVAELVALSHTQAA